MILPLTYTANIIASERLDSNSLSSHCTSAWQADPGKRTKNRQEREREGEKDWWYPEKHGYPDNSAVEAGPGPAGAEFFPGCLPLVWPHLSWVSARAPRGPLHSNYFNLTKHLIYFISPMRKVVCLNRACQPPETIQGNLLACLSEPRFAPLCLHRLLQWKRAAILHLFSWREKKRKTPKSSYSLGSCAVSEGWIDFLFTWLHLLWKAYL